MAGTVARMTAYLKARIDLGTLEPGSKLPPTSALMKQFELSDGAVYRGIGLLKAEGYVVSRQGKGVFVADRRKLIVGEKRIQGITHPNETIHHKRSVRVQAPEWVSAFLGEGECVNRVRTVVNRAGVVVEASQSWVHTAVAEFVPEIDEPRACDPSWQSLYADRSGNLVHPAAKTANVRIATDTDRENLGLDAGSPVLVTRSVYVTGTTAIGVGEAVYPPSCPLTLS
jgi:DNA-binding GntR family transcriptional regulator